jgi:hypothetical protein
VTHALGVVDAAFELVARETIRDATDHGPLPAMGVRQLTGRRVDLGRRRRGGGRLRRRGGARVGDMSNSLAESAANRSGAGWELERRPATGAIHQHRRSVDA